MVETTFRSRDISSEEDRRNCGTAGRIMRPSLRNFYFLAQAETPFSSNFLSLISKSEQVAEVTRFSRKTFLGNSDFSRLLHLLSVSLPLYRRATEWFTVTTDRVGKFVVAADAFVLVDGFSSPVPVASRDSCQGYHTLRIDATAHSGLMLVKTSFTRASICADEQERA